VAKQTPRHESVRTAATNHTLAGTAHVGEAADRRFFYVRERRVIRERSQISGKSMVEATAAKHFVDPGTGYG